MNAPFCNFTPLTFYSYQSRNSIKAQIGSTITQLNVKRIATYVNCARVLRRFEMNAYLTEKLSSDDIR